MQNIDGDLKNKKVEDALENNEEVNNVDETLEEAEINEDKEFEDEVSSPELCDVKALKKENESLKEELSSLKDRFLRLTAEYDNYRKRTTREKENIYLDACEDVLKEMFPVLDNLERALNASGSEEDLRKGIEMTVKQFNTSFEKLGVEEIATDMEFDPNFHNAVMHVEDENLGKNQVAEVFLKGYKKGNKVLRYSMVKVAN
ncbi:MAG: nucleotide exchange factor GrpE [Clostridium argentinense]|uniref:Protein GrpE n=1 Tax=Clostridium faecium TaxID=2762223 RepID=A0ABR8YX13_9CLOT|nr:nucleotide exchange factor GrpE [Clostridium faecium]MBS5825381.1 nucleotide exchange factor GrpE [Clostridium argentinense]